MPRPSPYPPYAAAYVLAQQSAIKAVRAQIKRSGGNPSLIPASRLARLGREWLAGHPEMLAAALADPIIASLASPRVPHRRPRRRTALIEKGNSALDHQ
jgi:hypothetical protein